MTASLCARRQELLNDVAAFGTWSYLFAVIFYRLATAFSQSFSLFLPSTVVRASQYVDM